MRREFLSPVAGDAVGRMRLARRDDIVFPVTVRGTVVARRRALVVPGRHRRGFAPAAFVVFHLRPSLSGQPKDGQNQPVDHARADAVDDHRPRDREDLDRRARDEALCLCQDRDEGNFCPILLGFWLIKFLKKSAFFAKLL